MNRANKRGTGKGFGVRHVEPMQERAPLCHFSDFSLLVSAFFGPLPRDNRAERVGRFLDQSTCSGELQLILNLFPGSLLLSVYHPKHV